MSAKEVRRIKSEEFPTSATLKQFLDNATASLLFKNFDACIEQCEQGLSHAKLCAEQENASVKEYMEKLSVVAVQAHAERNSWQQVLPFIQNVYRGVENCPATVLQVCLLLHAKVQEFSRCRAMTNVWLRNQDNFTDPEYGMIVDVFVRHVMLPQKQHSLVPAYLDSCHGLQSSQKQEMMLEYSRCIEEELKSSDTDGPVTDIGKSKHVTVPEQKGDGFWKSVKRMALLLYQKYQPYSLTAIISVAVVILAFVTVKINKGTFSRIHSPVIMLWQGLTDIFKSLMSLGWN